MQQIEVEPIGAEPPQAALAGARQALPPGVLGVGLADEEDLVAQPGNGLADELLGPPVAIHLGRVDQAHAGLDAGSQGGDLLRPETALLGHLPGALPERGHRLAAGQEHLAARTLSCIISESVGCGKTDWISSSSVVSRFMAMTKPWISSVTSAPTIWAPSSLPVLASKTVFTSPSGSPSAI